MKKNKTYFGIILLALLLLAACWTPLDAQCAMCKSAAEANLKQGGGDPKGLNNGILYMLAMPYLIVGAIGYWWWRNRKQQADELSESDFLK
jgi:hypothetical protein